MDTLQTSQNDLKILREDFAELKRDVSELMKHLKSGVSHDVETLVKQADDRAHKFYDEMNLRGTKSLKAINRQVELHPAATLAILIGCGIVSARLLAR